MESGSERRFAGGTLPLEGVGPWSWPEHRRRWESDPVWRSTEVPPGVELADSAEIGDWPLGRLRHRDATHPGPFRVREQVPADYEAYLRILCPFVGAGIMQDGKPIGHHLVTWNATAVQNGRIPHRLMDVVGIGPNHEDGLHGGNQPYQSLAPEQETQLFDILQRRTSSKSGWFLLWDGDYHGSVGLPESSMVHDRESSLRFCAFHGPLSAWDGFWSEPRWWWPDDKAWCFQTNIDLDMTNCIYLGASQVCVEEILDNPIIEAVVAYPDDPASAMDTINRTGRD